MRRHLRIRSMVFVALVAALGSAAGAPAFAHGAPTPSAKARMICADEAQEDLAGVLAVRAEVTTPTWRHRTYRCTYRYSNGSFDISVVEYPKIAPAKAEFTRQQLQPEVTHSDLGLANGSFLRADGSVVVRVDRRLLDIDPTRMPRRFGKIHMTRAAVAEEVAVVILRCWSA